MVGENGDMSDAPSGENYRFFNHSACEFYPCHDMPAEDLNCLFCFCPLYRLGEDCGGNFTYVNGADGAHQGLQRLHRAAPARELRLHHRPPRLEIRV